MKQPCGTYHIVGYSYGTIVAYEIAWQLQQIESSSDVSLTLIDSSNLNWQKYREIYRKIYNFGSSDLANHAQFETELLYATTLFLVDTDQEALREALMQMHSWEERLDYALSKLITIKEHLQIHSENLKTAATALMQKFVAADRYRPQDKTSKFTGHVTLIRAANGALTTTDTSSESDYGLKQVPVIFCKLLLGASLIEGYKKCYSAFADILREF